MELWKPKELSRPEHGLRCIISKCKNWDERSKMKLFKLRNSQSGLSMFKSDWAITNLNKFIFILLSQFLLWIYCPSSKTNTKICSQIIDDFHRGYMVTNVTLIGCQNLRKTDIEYSDSFKLAVYITNKIYENQSVYFISCLCLGLFITGYYKW